MAYKKKIFDDRRTASKKCPKCDSQMVRLKYVWACACGNLIEHKLK